MYETDNPKLLGFRQFLLEVFEQHFGYRQEFDVVCWFHGTRVLPGTTFADGIFPLVTSLPRLKEMLVNAVEAPATRQRLHDVLAADRVADTHYFLKTKNPGHGGPYGMLVREALFYPDEMNQCSYLGMPEIIEDICHGFQNSENINLIEDFRTALRPAIVKFWSLADDQQSCLSAAVNYAYSSIHSGKPNGHCMRCFDGDGQPVPPENIVSVEFVDFSGTER